MKPIILDNAVNRMSDNNKPFNYSYADDINVVIEGKSVKPFIEISSCDTELKTLTEVANERDDEGYSLAELETKTKVVRERDDEGFSLAELETKTFVERERDDEDSSSYYQQG